MPGVQVWTPELCVNTEVPFPSPNSITLRNILVYTDLGLEFHASSSAPPSSPLPPCAGSAFPRAASDCGSCNCTPSWSTALSRDGLCPPLDRVPSFLSSPLLLRYPLGASERTPGPFCGQEEKLGETCLRPPLLTNYLALKMKQRGLGYKPMTGRCHPRKGFCWRKGHSALLPRASRQVSESEAPQSLLSPDSFMEPGTFYW